MKDEDFVGFICLSYASGYALVIIVLFLMWMFK